MKPLSVTFALLSAVLMLGCQQGGSTSVSTAGIAQPQPSQGRTDTGSHERAAGTSGQFDFYLLTLSWSPEYCVSHRSAAECAAHPAFVLHGLWPENANGSYPQHCSSAPGPSNPSEYSDIFPDAGLLQHEWQTHGTCSGLSPDAYFTSARKAFHSVNIPPQLASVKAPTQMPPQAILSEFAQANSDFPSQSFVLACGNNRLTAVEACLDKNLRAVSCGRIRSCGATVVKITPPGASSDR